MYLLLFCQLKTLYTLASVLLTWDAKYRKMYNYQLSFLKLHKRCITYFFLAVSFFFSLSFFLSNINNLYLLPHAFIIFLSWSCTTHFTILHIVLNSNVEKQTLPIVYSTGQSNNLTLKLDECYCLKTNCTVSVDQFQLANQVSIVVFSKILYQQSIISACDIT